MTHPPGNDTSPVPPAKDLSRRRFQRGYEIGVPIALGLIVLFIIALIVIIAAVLLGWYPGS